MGSSVLREGSATFPEPKKTILLSFSTPFPKTTLRTILINDIITSL